jgi:rubrerythrin
MHASFGETAPAEGLDEIKRYLGILARAEHAHAAKFADAVKCIL